MKKLLFALISLLIPNVVFSANIDIKNIDTDNWPSVKFSVVLPTSNESKDNYYIKLDGYGSDIAIDNFENSDAESKKNNIVIAVDTSKSVDTSYFEGVIQGLIGYFKYFTGKDEQIAIIGFDDNVDLYSGLTSDREQLISKARELKQNGTTTDLFSAILRSCELLQSADGLHTLILITDGHDETQKYNQEDILKPIKDNNIVVYSIGLKPVTKEAADGPKYLEGLSVETHGFIENVDNSHALSSALTSFLQKSNTNYPVEYAVTFSVPEDLQKGDDQFKLKLMQSGTEAPVAEMVLQSKSEPEPEKVEDVKPAEKELPSIMGYVIGLLVIVLLLVAFLVFRKRKTSRAVQTIDNNAASQYAIEFEKFGIFYRLPYGNTRVGADAGNEIVLNEPTVSRRHALFYVTNSMCQIQDLNSTNGIYINDVKIDRPTALNPGDKLNFGRATGIVKYSNR